MIFDQVYIILLQMFDAIIDFLPNAPFTQLLDWLDWTDYAELISNIIYFVPVDCIAFFINWCLPMIACCAVVGMLRLVWEIIPFT